MYKECKAAFLNFVLELSEMSTVYIYQEENLKLKRPFMKCRKYVHALW